MLSNVQRPLFKKSLPVPPKNAKKSSTVLTTSEKDEEYFASLFAAVESPIKSPIPAAIEAAEQVYFTPGTLHKANHSYPHVEYGGLSDRFEQQFNPNKSHFEQNTENLGSKPLPLPPSPIPAVSKNNASLLHSKEEKDSHGSQQSTNHPVNYVETVQATQQYTSSNSKNPNVSKKAPPQQETDFWRGTNSSEQFSASHHSQLQDSYSIESDETESVSSIENQTDLSSPTSIHSFKVPLPRKKPTADRPKSVSIPQPRAQTTPYSTSWKSESSLSLEKLKSSSHTDFTIFKPSSNINPLKRISRALNSLPGNNNGGSPKAKQAYSNLGKTSAERVEAYKRQMLELQNQRTDIHCWVNIMKSRDRRTMENTPNSKRHLSVVHQSVEPSHMPKLGSKTEKCQPTTNFKSDLTYNHDKWRTSAVEQNLKSGPNRSLRDSAETDYQLDIPIETSGSLFDWDHFDRELTKLNRNCQDRVPNSTEIESMAPKQAEDKRTALLKHSSKEHSKSASKRSSSQIVSSRRTAGDENNRSRPHSYHPSLHADGNHISSHKYSSSFPSKMAISENNRSFCTDTHYSSKCKGKAPSTYIKGDSDDETPLCIVASRKLNKPHQRTYDGESGQISPIKETTSTVLQEQEIEDLSSVQPAAKE